MGWPQLRPRKNLTSCPGLVDHYTFEGRGQQLKTFIRLVPNFLNRPNERGEEDRRRSFRCNNELSFETFDETYKVFANHGQLLALHEFSIYLDRSLFKAN